MEEAKRLQLTKGLIELFWVEEKKHFVVYDQIDCGTVVLSEEDAVAIAQTILDNRSPTETTEEWAKRITAYLPKKEDRNWWIECARRQEAQAGIIFPAVPEEPEKKLKEYFVPDSEI
jgi:hypothetical protein